MLLLIFYLNLNLFITTKEYFHTRYLASEKNSDSHLDCNLKTKSLPF